MTTNEKDAMIGRAFRELTETKLEVDGLEKRLRCFRKRVQAALDDWDNLSVLNGVQLAVNRDSRSLPTDREIAEVLDRIRKRTEDIARFDSELKAFTE